MISLPPGPTALLPVVDLPGRDAAREAAQRELARHPYREAQGPWYLRLLQWVLDKLQELVARASSRVPGGGWGLVALSLLVLLLVAVVVVRVRPTRRAGGPQGLFEGISERTAAEHRAAAERAAAAGDLGEAVQERFRAVVRELESRGVLDPRPGRTADEVAREVGRAVPVLSESLMHGATLFDEVRYGGRAAGLSAYQVVVELDEQVLRSRLVPA